MRTAGLAAVVLFVGVLLDVGATNYYLRPSGGGGGGTSWSDAWNGTGGIDWNRLAPGDVVYVAGGSYTGFAMGADGVSGKQITIRRATGSDHGTSTGWSSSYDSRVLINGGSGNGISFSGKGNYVTIDGVVEDGITISIRDGTNLAGINFYNATSYVEMKNLEVAGPGVPGNWMNTANSVRGIDVTPGTGGLSSNILISHCNVHGMPFAVYFSNVQYGTVEFCHIYDIRNNGSSHENVFYITGQSDHGIFRYNEVWNYEAEGVYFAGPNEKHVTDWKIYGNIFRDGVGYTRVLQPDLQKYGGGSVTDLYLYNNTIVNMWMAITAGADQVMTGEAKNNILWNVKSTSWSKLVHDYNFDDGTLTSGEPHGITNGADPFLNLAGNDFHIRANSSARDQGMALAAEYNQDGEGTTRGADGSWDMGAYEYTESGIEDLKLQIANRKLQISPSLPFQCYDVLGKLIPGWKHTGIYLVVPEDQDRISKITVLR